MLKFDTKTIILVITNIILLSIVSYLIYKSRVVTEKMVPVAQPPKSISANVGKVIESEDFVLDTEVHMPDTEIEPKKDIESFSNNKLTSLDEAFKLLNNDDKK